MLWIRESWLSVGDDWLTVLVDMSMRFVPVAAAHQNAGRQHIGTEHKNIARLLGRRGSQIKFFPRSPVELENYQH